MMMDGTCVSGKETSESVQIGSDFVPFRRIALAQPNVSEIISVTDSLGNVYYHVEALTHDVVYQNVLNTAKDSDLVPGALKVTLSNEGSCVPLKSTPKSSLRSAI